MSAASNAPGPDGALLPSGLRVGDVMPQAQPGLAYRPEFFPLPSRGRDPHFGLSRSTYYSLERDGLLRLVRIRRPGHLRGKVLVPYAEVTDLIRRLGHPASTSRKVRS